MKVQIDIENSKTQKVVSIDLSLLDCKSKNFIFDISNVTESELNILKNAINPKLSYTDIELFFIENDKYPYFGPDYEYKIEDHKLYCFYTRDKFSTRKH